MKSRVIKNRNDILFENIGCSKNQTELNSPNEERNPLNYDFTYVILRNIF